MSSQFKYETSVRDNNVITLTFNLTMIEYLFGKRIYLKDIFSLQSLQTVELLASLCSLDECPYCKGTGTIFCSQLNPSNSTDYCRFIQGKKKPKKTAEVNADAIVTENFFSTEIFSNYSFPCPYCNGLGKVDSSREKMIEFYHQGIFRKSLSPEEESFLTTNQTQSFKNCYYYLKQMQEKLNLPYYLQIPSFSFPTKHHYLSYSLPFQPFDGYFDSINKPIEIIIQEIIDTESILIQKENEYQLYFVKNNTHYQWSLDVWISSEEAFHGFQREVPLFPLSIASNDDDDTIPTNKPTLENPFPIPSYGCQPFQIKRIDQFTLPNSSLTIPLPMLFHHLCQPIYDDLPQDNGNQQDESTNQQHKEQDENEELRKQYELFPTNYQDFYENHINHLLSIHFHLITEEDTWKLLKEKWNCKNEITRHDQSMAKLIHLFYMKYQYINSKGIFEEIYCLTIPEGKEHEFPEDDQGRILDPVTGNRVLSPKYYFTNYQYERLMELKLRNWFKFLSQV